ncbi:DUF4054 domain-containing protein [Lactiplantibacillus nangangensis]|uniref:DUF4054 domain-containing protein n=1 Tax=Lactiplantibacillus nangangensis TaxID=2559917 RepID=A0ABW1SMU8_9LACO|nr:DUF4054 domain-containing protein [Lactiplantibacillus nangangensis]
MDGSNKSTSERVRLVRSDLTKVSDETIDLAIDDAWVVIQRQHFAKDIQEQACRYLAAGMISREDDRVSLKQVGDLKKQYFKGVNPWYDHYLDLLNRFGDGGGLRMVVFG